MDWVGSAAAVTRRWELTLHAWCRKMQDCGNPAQPQLRALVCGAIAACVRQLPCPCHVFSPGVQGGGRCLPRQLLRFVSAQGGGKPRIGWEPPRRQRHWRLDAHTLPNRYKSPAPRSLGSSCPGSRARSPPIRLWWVGRGAVPAEPACLRPEGAVARQGGPSGQEANRLARGALGVWPGTGWGRGAKPSCCCRQGAGAHMLTGREGGGVGGGGKAVRLGCCSTTGQTRPLPPLALRGSCLAPHLHHWLPRPPF